MISSTRWPSLARPAKKMNRRLGLVYLGVFVIALLLIVIFNMVLFGKSVGEALANPYMWMENRHSRGNPDLPLQVACSFGWNRKRPACAFNDLFEVF